MLEFWASWLKFVLSVSKFSSFLELKIFLKGLYLYSRPIKYSQISCRSRNDFILKAGKHFHLPWFFIFFIFIINTILLEMYFPGVFENLIHFSHTLLSSLARKIVTVQMSYKERKKCLNLVGATSPWRSRSEQDSEKLSSVKDWDGDCRMRLEAWKGWSKS